MSIGEGDHELMSLIIWRNSYLYCSGFNSLFGPKYCRFYSEEEVAPAYLIREIRLCGGLVDGFSMEELDYIILLLVCTV